MDSKDNAESGKVIKSFHLIEDSEKKAILEDVSGKTGMPPFAVEKDWWVTQALRILYSMEIGKHLVFKGGTSLSKGWGLIERFSEDIDLAVDREFLGFDGELSNTQISKLRKAAHKYITETLAPELEAKFKEYGLDKVEFKVIETNESDQDPSIIEIYYETVIGSPSYIENRVQIEIGCRSLHEPFTTQPITALVDHYYPDFEFTMPAFDVPIVNPERTFLEKIFLLHEEFHKPKEKIRINRLSRHLYDVFQLSRSKYAAIVLEDKGLYETIVKHRHSYTRVGGVDYNSHQPKTVDPFPKDEIIDDWRKDYLTMQEQMIFGESPSFDEMIKAIEDFIVQLKKVDWKVNHEFLPPAHQIQHKASTK